MSDIYTYRVGVITAGGMDLTGYDVVATDGSSIGKIDEASNETSASTLVVDTGFWIFGKKRLIPAGVVTRIDEANHNVHVGLSKEQIKEAPDYDPELHRRDERGYRDQVGSYYSRYH